MVIFNSYVKLPEGNLSNIFLGLPRLPSGHSNGHPRGQGGHETLRRTELSFALRGGGLGFHSHGGTLGPYK